MKYPLDSVLAQLSDPDKIQPESRERAAYGSLLQDAFTSSAVEHFKDDLNLDYYVHTFNSLKRPIDTNFTRNEILAGIEVIKNPLGAGHRFYRRSFVPYEVLRFKYIFYTYPWDPERIEKEKLKRDADLKFVESTLKFYGLDWDLVFCTEVMNSLRYATNCYFIPKLEPEDVEKIFFDHFHRDSPTVSPFPDILNPYQTAFLSSMALSRDNVDLDYLVSTTQRLTMEGEPEMPMEWIIDGYRSSSEQLKRADKRIDGQKIITKSMEESFIQSTLPLYPDEIDLEFCSEVLSRFRGRFVWGDALSLTTDQVDSIFFEAFHRDNPRVTHLLDHHNDFQRAFISHAALHYGPGADLKYVETVFNELALDETQRIESELLLATYKESLETLKVQVHRVEHFDDELIKLMMKKFMDLTIDHFVRNIDFEFARKVLDSFQAADELVPMRVEHVLRMFICCSGYIPPNVEPSTFLWRFY